MKLDTGVSRRIKNHLNEIGDHLHHLPQAEQKEVLRLVYNHILNALASRPKSRQDIQAVEAILAGMDSPGSYAGKSVASLATQEPRILPEEQKHAPSPAKGRNWTLVSLLATGVLLLLALGVLKLAANRPHQVQALEFPIDPVFINDPGIPGQWAFTDNTNLMARFQIGGEQAKGGNPPFKKIRFLPGGSSESPPVGWTKGIVLQTKNKTANRYVLKTIDGIEYMLLESLARPS